MAVKRMVCINMTLEEMKALRDRLVPIAPLDYSLEAYTFLRNLYGNLERRVFKWEGNTERYW